ncbi:lipopolysaccharide biosynthesis protein RfbH [Curvibacter gracilis]|uniref:lipopolysaccharide biosynthesis protein RfbH n=1 Tax=Curvibacter gracilis TaxID=230310 RepID=UPI0004AFCBFA|nr:lipopolysaccharide biosynthesis protein RfbH [Curvibacter gracilis]
MSLTRHQLTAAADGQVHLNLPELAGQELEIIVRPARAAATAQPWRAGIDAIPPSGKVVGDPEKNAMIDAALDAWLTTGRFNDAFEKRLADFVGVKHALTVNSGSSANLVAFSTLTSPRLGIRAIRPGDEVITVAAGFPTTVNPIIQNGAVPVFVDAVLPTYNIDVSQLEAALSPRTKAIMIAHTLGNPFDLDAVCAFAQAHGLWLVEDCCDALGSTWKGRKVGTFGHLATLSFYPAHHITMGEGGAVLTSDPELRQIAESFRDWGRDCWCKPGCDNTCGKRFNWQLGSLPAGYDHKYTYSHLGYNLKITDMQAACGLAQLDRLEGFVQARKDNFAYLSEQLKDCADLLVLPEATPGSDPSWFGFPITLRPEAGLNRQYLLQYLDEHRIGTRLLFAGNLIHQPYMQDRNFRVVGSLKAADQIMNDTFWIGVWPGLSRAQLDYMVSQLRQVLGLNF